MFHTLDRITVVHSDQRLLVHYFGGGEVLFDFKPLVERGGVFAKLADPRFFAQAAVGERGRYIEWPGELDFCADALWEQGRQASGYPVELRRG
jgi:hypothetical protein